MRQVKAETLRLRHIAAMLAPLTANRAIAVVANDAAFGTALQYALEVQGYAVSLFGRVQEAMDSRQILSADCLLIDFALPDGDGLTLLDALRQRGLTCPVIIIDGQLGAGRRTQAEKAGVIVLEKPVMGDILNRALRQVFTESDMR